MGYTIEELSDENIIVCTWDEEFSFADELQAFHNTLFNILENLTDPIYLVISIDSAKMTFNDIISGLQLAIRSKTSTLGHQNTKKVLFVTTSKIIQKTATGLRTASFGNLDVSIFATLDEALNFAREHAA